MTNTLTNDNYWDSINDAYELTDAGPSDRVRIWLESLVKEHHIQAGRSFEIGCYPGQYQPVLGGCGFELNGLDIAEGVEGKLVEWLIAHKCQVGKFCRHRFEDFVTSDKYDLVCSFGFVEHFRNWEEILVKHVGLIAPSGWLIVATPNFRGLVQRLLHAYLDRNNMMRHNLAAMNTRQWARIVERAGLSVKFSGCFGGFDFWADPVDLSFVQKKVLNGVASVLPVARKIKRSSCLFSPYCGLVARREDRV